MRRIAFLLVAMGLLACSPENPDPHELRTLEDAGPELRPVERTEALGADSEGSDGDPSEEGGSVNLPFAPAISMDPVDGSKVSIRANTPVTEHAGRIYYFNSEENRRKFLEDPSAYVR